VVEEPDLATGFWTVDFLCDNPNVDDCFNLATSLQYKFWANAFGTKEVDEFDFSLRDAHW